jgi:hypothetical protein
MGEAKLARARSPKPRKASSNKMTANEAPQAEIADTGAQAAQAPAADPNPPISIGLDSQNITLKHIGAMAAILGKIAAVLSALLLSGPVWMAISICGPHMPLLFVPTLFSAVLRLVLVLCHLIQEALVDGELDKWEILGVGVRFVSDVLVTASAVLPQPLFITVIGGSFTSGDAARAAHMRTSRWVWRLTVGLSVEYIVALAVLIYIVVPRLSARFYEKIQNALVPGSLRNILDATPPCLWVLAKGVALSICWTVLAARMKMLPIDYLLGIDPSSYLASVIPDEMLMFRRELSLFHLFTSTFPFLTASTIAIGDGLMSNPALPGYVGLSGSFLLGFGLWWADQPIQDGYWLAAGAWGMLALMNYVFEKYEVKHLEVPTTIDIGPIATVDLDDVEIDSEPTATLSFKIPFSEKSVPFETPFKIAVCLCVCARPRLKHGSARSMCMHTSMTS